jgi:hypothetical protein
MPDRLIAANVELPTASVTLASEVVAPRGDVAIPSAMSMSHVIGRVYTFSATDIADQIRAFVAVFISNGTPAHPDAGLLIGNGGNA